MYVSGAGVARIRAEHPVSPNYRKPLTDLVR